MQGGNRLSYPTKKVIRSRDERWKITLIILQKQTRSFHSVYEPRSEKKKDIWTFHFPSRFFVCRDVYTCHQVWSCFSQHVNICRASPVKPSHHFPSYQAFLSTITFLTHVQSFWVAYFTLLCSLLVARRFHTSRMFRSADQQFKQMVERSPWTILSLIVFAKSTIEL
jgi:hypothetical protein